MRTITVSRPAGGEPYRSARLEEELRHIRDLVFVRELLRERGAGPGELRECDAAIDEAHARMADAAKRAVTAAAV